MMQPTCSLPDPDHGLATRSVADSAAATGSGDGLPRALSKTLDLPSGTPSVP